MLTLNLHKLDLLINRLYDAWIFYKGPNQGERWINGVLHGTKWDA